MNAMGTNIAVTTFSFVSGPLGISIMALLENIEKFAQLPQYRGVGDIAILDPNPPFATRQIPGRGAALVAVRDIAFGQLIMHEAPIFMRDEEFHSKLSTADCVKFTLEAVHQLPAETQAVFFNLHQQGIGEEVEDIISTNSFKVRIGEGSDQRTYAAVVPGIARLNHACRPNAWYRFDYQTMRMRIIAVKNIQAGEEITISYITPGYTKAERTTGIQISWGFYCNCPLCSASEATTNESDARIIKIKLLQQELGNWDDTNIVAGQAELLIQLAVQEGMVPITGQYLLAAFTYSSLGLLDKSLEFARKAVTSGSKFEGEDDSLFIKAKEFVDNPTEHWSWKLRVVEEAENGTTQNED